MKASDLRNNLFELQKDLISATVRYENLNKEIVQYTKACTDIDTFLKTEVLVLEVLKNLEEQTKQKTIEYLQEFVSYGLEVVFHEDLKFAVTVKDTSGVSLTLFHDGVESPIMEAHGGGVAQVVAFLIRVIYVLKHPSKMRPIIFLDEQFSFVSDDHLESLGALLKELTSKLSFKLLHVTHEKVLKDVSDNSYRIYKDNVTKSSKLDKINDLLKEIEV
ncbi:MAG: hypothetical protein WC783_00885 [Candidatus Paceibacterota bacterium]|jgi:hypothetical protein